MARWLPALLLFACGNPWVVVRQASPNPFVGHRTFGIDAMHYENLRVGGNTEAEHLADKDPAQRASWEQDKAGLDTEFRGGLTEELRGHPLVAPGGDPFTMRPHVTFIEPGIYTHFFNRATEVHLTVFFLDARTGAVLDEIQFECTEEPTITTPSSGQRLRTCGSRLGSLVAEYVAARTGVD